MVELMVVVALIGCLSAMAVWGIRGWSASNAFKGAPQQLSSLMRTTQQQAITEGNWFCVKFDTGSDTYSVYRNACTDPASVKTNGPFGLGSAAIHLSGPMFVDPSGTTQTGVSFSPRGSAWPGQVTLVRDGSTLTHVVRVEGMTGRVSTN